MPAAPARTWQVGDVVDEVTLNAFEQEMADTVAAVVANKVYMYKNLGGSL